MIHKDQYIKDILNGTVGQAVEAHGWVKTRRDSKGVHFVQINDGSCFQDLQVVIDEGTIVGQGTHRELMRTSEVYREIVSSQLSPEEVA